MTWSERFGSCVIGRTVGRYEICVRCWARSCKGRVVPRVAPPLCAQDHRQGLLSSLPPQGLSLLSPGVRGDGSRGRHRWCGCPSHAPARHDRGRGWPAGPHSPVAPTRGPPVEDGPQALDSPVAPARGVRPLATAALPLAKLQRCRWRGGTQICQPATSKRRWCGCPRQRRLAEMSCSQNNPRQLATSNCWPCDCPGQRMLAGTSCSQKNTTLGSTRICQLATSNCWRCDCPGQRTLHVLPEMTTCPADVHCPDVLQEGRVVRVSSAPASYFPTYSRMFLVVFGRGTHLSRDLSLGGISCRQGNDGLTPWGIFCRPTGRLITGLICHPSGRCLLWGIFCRPTGRLITGPICPLSGHCLLWAHLLPTHWSSDHGPDLPPLWVLPSLGHLLTGRLIPGLICQPSLGQLLPTHWSSDHGPDLPPLWVLPSLPCLLRVRRPIAGPVSGNSPPPWPH